MKLRRKPVEAEAVFVRLDGQFSDTPGWLVQALESQATEIGSITHNVILNDNQSNSIASWLVTRQGPKFFHIGDFVVFDEYGDIDILSPVNFNRLYECVMDPVALSKETK